MNRNTKVSLFIVGQPKSGTTALARYLSQHPDICMSSLKEPNFFATDFLRESDEFHGLNNTEFLVRDIDQYEKLFEEKPQAKVLGEASTAYLYSKEAAKNIHDYNPDAKIVMFLREPVSFLHSLHMQYVNEVNEDELDFERALDKETERKQGSQIPKNVRCPSYLYYGERIKYAEQIKRYMDIFPQENILIYSFDEFKRDNQKIYKEVLNFVGADESFVPDFKMVHESKTPRSTTLNELLRHRHVRKTSHKVLGTKRYTRIQKIVEKLIFRKQQRKDLDERVVKSLRLRYEPEVEKVSKLTGIDFSKEWSY